jgi:PadR family transcriptional regulator, regulatory protein AphA
VGYVWHAPDSQIYPELRKMEKDGLLQGREVPWGQRGRKTEYHVTDAGITAFREWMNGTLEYSRERDPMHLKAAYFEWAEPEAVRRQLRAHEEHYRERKAQWEDKIREIDTGNSDILNRRLATLPENEHRAAAAFKRYTYQGLVARAEQEIEWARQGLVLVDDLYGN